MTDKQQKPTHYKKLHRYIQILQPKIKRKKTWSLKQNIQYKMWQVLGYIQSFGTVWDGCMQGWWEWISIVWVPSAECSGASISQWLLVVGHDGFTHKICHCTANGGCCLQHFVLFYSTFWQGVHCKSTNWSVTAAWKYSKTWL